jgi:hypothetical protein
VAPGGAERWHLIHPGGAYAGSASAPDQIPASIHAHKTDNGTA